MGWQSIANYTQRSLDRTDRATAEKAASRQEGINTVLQGVSLLDKWSSGQKELSALKEYGEQEGLTYDKKTKSFYGTLEGADETKEQRIERLKVSSSKLGTKPAEFQRDPSQSYRVSSTDLRNIRDLTAYGGQTFKSMITGKGGQVKGAYAYNPKTPERPVVPIESEDEYFDEEIVIDDWSNNKDYESDKAFYETEWDDPPEWDVRNETKEQRMARLKVPFSELGTKPDEFIPEYGKNLQEGGDEPYQESESGGVDPNPKGPSLWSKFKGHVSGGMEETGGEFAFENFGDVARGIGSGVSKFMDSFKKEEKQPDKSILDIVKLGRGQNIPFENRDAYGSGFPTSDWSDTALNLGRPENVNAGAAGYDYGLFNTKKDKQSLVGGTEFKSSSDKYIHWPWDD